MWNFLFAGNKTVPTRVFHKLTNAILTFKNDSYTSNCPLIAVLCKPARRAVKTRTLIRLGRNHMKFCETDLTATSIRCEWMTDWARRRRAAYVRSQIQHADRSVSNRSAPNRASPRAHCIDSVLFAHRQLFWFFSRARGGKTVIVNESFMLSTRGIRMRPCRE